MGSATVVHVWRGADSANPFNVTPTIASSANGSAANPAAITPTTAGSVVLYFGHASQLAASGTVFTTAGTYPISVKTDGSTGDSIVMASHYTAWTSGAYDPAAFAGSTTATTLGWLALTVVIKPATPVAKTATSTLGGAVLAAQTKTATLGGAVQTSDTKTATLGAIVVTAQSKTASLDGVIRQRRQRPQRLARQSFRAKENRSAWRGNRCRAVENSQP